MKTTLFLLALIFSLNALAEAPRACTDKTLCPADQCLMGERPTNCSTRTETVSTLCNATYCCYGLAPQGEACVDPSAIDNKTPFCTADSDCSDGNGCFESKASDFFNASSQSDPNFAAFILENTRYPDKSTTGTPCDVNAQCASRSCGYLNNSSKVCMATKVCRKAELYERASGSVKCMDGLTVDQRGVCAPPPGELSSLTQNVLDNFNIELTEDCKHNLDQDTINQSKLNIKAFRAFEFLFAYTETEGQRWDYTHIVSQLMKQEIAGKISEKRKTLIKEFNQKYLEIAQDFNTVAKATKGSKNIVTYEGKPVPEDYLAQRAATGLDALYLMRRTTLLYQDYELKMNQMVVETYDKMLGVKNFVMTTPSNVKQWDIAGIHGNISKPGARPELWDSLSHRYSVINLPANKAPFNADFLSSYMFAITGTNPNRAFPGDYYLLDPVLPMGMSSDPGRTSFMAYGNHPTIWTEVLVGAALDFFLTGGLAAGGGIGALIGELSQKQKWWRVLNGEATTAQGMRGSDLGMMKKGFKETLVAYYKSFRPANTPDFVFEPELLNTLGNEALTETYKSNACLDQALKDEVSAECAPVKEFIDQAADIAFAQFWAWSAHDRDSYSRYWGGYQTMRAKLLGYYEALYLNLAGYYYSMAVAKELKKECIDKAIANIRFDFIQTNPNAGGVQVAESTNYYEAGGKDYAGTPDKDKSKTRVTVKRDGKIFLDPSTFASQDFSSRLGTVSSGAKGSAAGTSGAVGGLSSAMRNRLNEIKTAKTKINAGDLDKHKKAMATLTTSGKSGGASSAGSAASNNFFGNQATGKASLSTDKEVKKNEGTGSAAAAPTNNATTASQGSSGPMMSFSSPDKSLSEATGMSDQESDVVMKTLEKDKNHYESKEEDGLFEVVSKTYMRNLNRFLTPKKQIKE